MFAAICIGGWFVIVAGLLWSNHRWQQVQPPEPQTVEFPPFGSDPDDDTVRVTKLPPVPASRRSLPDESPLDLSGFALDARFFAVLAPSFREYQ